MATLTVTSTSTLNPNAVVTSKPRGARLRHPVRIAKHNRDLSAAITSSGSSSWAGPAHSPSEVYIARVPLVGLEALDWGLGSKLRGIPKRKCELIGQAVVGQRLGDGMHSQREIDARCAEFQKEWDPYLSLQDHSCREHSAALASMLTGKEVSTGTIGPHATPAFSA